MSAPFSFSAPLGGPPRVVTVPIQGKVTPRALLDAVTAAVREWDQEWAFELVADDLATPRSFKLTARRLR